MNSSNDPGMLISNKQIIGQNLACVHVKYDDDKVVGALLPFEPGLNFP
jgi:hypothetical protein